MAGASMSGFLKQAITAVMFLSVVLPLSSCADSPEEKPSLAQNADRADSSVPQGNNNAAKPKYMWACSKGTKFNARFSRNGNAMFLLISGNSRPTKLKDEHVASGSEYGNGKVFYKEYKGRTYLVRKIDGKVQTETCRQSN